MRYKNIVPIALSLSFLVIALSIAYYLIVFIPKNEQEKIKQVGNVKTQEMISEQAKQANIDKCFKDAEDNYTSNWNETCKTRGQKELCSLPAYEADDIEKLRQTRKEQCLKRYN